MREWNPRFRAYANAQGRTPAEQLDHDREAWPGGHMTGYILWMADRRRALRAAGRIPRDLDLWLLDADNQRAYTEMLEEITCDT